LTKLATSSLQETSCTMELVIQLFVHHKICPYKGKYEYIHVQTGFRNHSPSRQMAQVRACPVRTAARVSCDALAKQKKYEKGLVLTDISKGESG
jgi:hypothetical protein